MEIVNPQKFRRFVLVINAIFYAVICLSLLFILSVSSGIEFFLVFAIFLLMIWFTFHTLWIQRISVDKIVIENDSIYIFRNGKEQKCSFEDVICERSRVRSLWISHGIILKVRNGPRYFVPAVSSNYESIVLKMRECFPEEPS